MNERRMESTRMSRRMEERKTNEEEQCYGTICNSETTFDSNVRC